MTEVPARQQHAWRRCVTVAALAAAVLACGRSSPGPTRLPESLGEWRATGEPAEFAGDDLFIYIDGGAEIYHEHGFDRLEVRDYSRGDEHVSVELYTMTDSAYGIYSYARSASGRPVSLGAGGTLADYYLHFWSGPHLVTVTARTVSQEAQEAVFELGSLLAAGFPDSGEVPRLMGLLPVESCAAGSERYVAGPIGLNSAAPAAAALFTGFQEAVVAHCRSATGESARLVVLQWTDAAAAERALTEALQRAASSDGINGGQVSETAFTFTLDEDRHMVGGRTGALVRLAVARGSDELHLDRLFPIEDPEVSDEREERTR